MPFLNSPILLPLLKEVEQKDPNLIPSQPTYARNSGSEIITRGTDFPEH